MVEEFNSWWGARASDGRGWDDDGGRECQGQDHPGRTEGPDQVLAMGRLVCTGDLLPPQRCPLTTVCLSAGGGRRGTEG